MKYLAAILILISFSLLNADYKVLQPYGRTVTLFTQEIAGTDYSSLAQISFVMPGADAVLGKYLLKSKDYTISFLPASFLVAMERPGFKRVVQMELPAVIIGNKLMIPVISFFTKLPHLGLYNTSISGNKIIMANPATDFAKANSTPASSNEIIKSFKTPDDKAIRLLTKFSDLLKYDTTKKEKAATVDIPVDKSEKSFKMKESPVSESKEMAISPEEGNEKTEDELSKKAADSYVIPPKIKDKINNKLDINR